MLDDRGVLVLTVGNGIGHGLIDISLPKRWVVVRVVKGIGVHGHVVHRVNQAVQIGVVVFRPSATPRRKIVRTGDPQIARQIARALETLKVLDPTQNHLGRDKVGRCPMHHGLVANCDDFNDVGVLLGQGHRTLNLRFIRFDVLLGVVGGVGPRAGAIDPSAQHHIHLEVGIRFLQLGYGLDHVGGVGQLDVVGPQKPDSHRMHQHQVFFQLLQGRLLRPVQPTVAAI